MPTYVYECGKCAKVFEVEQRMVDDPLTDCKCGAKGALKRLIQPTAVMFKGGGFYINDSSKNDSSSDTEEKPSDAKETKSDSKEKKSEPSGPDSSSKSNSDD